MKKFTLSAGGEKETTDLANLLLLFSGNGGVSYWEEEPSPERVFECKTCNRRFPSFQALGGHRASHKKPKTARYVVNRGDPVSLVPMKPRSHECSVCGLEFPVGQALGGHMRRHRAASTAVHGESCGKKTALRLDLNLTPAENEMECRNVIIGIEVVQRCHY